MHTDVATNASESRANADGRARAQRKRSAVTSGRRLYAADGDPNSAWSRRFTDVIASHLSDLGGVSATSVAEQSIVRRTATLTVELERLEASFAVAAPEASALDLYQRTANSLRRLLESIGLERRAKDVTPPTLQQYQQQYLALRATETPAQALDDDPVPDTTPDGDGTHATPTGDRVPTLQEYAIAHYGGRAALDEPVADEVLEPMPPPPPPPLRPPVHEGDMIDYGGGRLMLAGHEPNGQLRWRILRLNGIIVTHFLGDFAAARGEVDRLAALGHIGAIPATSAPVPPPARAPGIERPEWPSNLALQRGDTPRPRSYLDDD